MGQTVKSSVTPIQPEVKFSSVADAARSAAATFGLPYLEPNGQRGGVEENGAVGLELKRQGACGRTYIEMFGANTGLPYYKRVSCFKFWCPTCGGIDGKIHKKRVSAVLRRVGPVEDQFVRQLVFTVPVEERWRFKSRDGLNRLAGAAKRLVAKYFEGGRYVAYIHVYGDVGEGVYHPHINVHIFEPNDGRRWVIPGDQLEQIKESWKRALRGFGCLDLGMVDVHYSYRASVGHVLHAIKYMARPTQPNLNLLTYEEIEFLTLEMKGFQFVRFWGKFANSEYRDDDMKEEMDDAKEVAGEDLIYVGVVSEEEMLLKYRASDLEDLGGGLLRVKPEHYHKPKNRWR